MPAPAISIIITSYNQASYLAQTLDSIIGQSIPAGEIIVIDGGSTDSSVDIIRKYESSITYWVSERDKGQTDAINKGLRKMTGEVWCYLNSDDLLEPSCLALVARHFENPGLNWLSGSARMFDQSGDTGTIRPAPVAGLLDYLRPWKRAEQYVFPFSGSCFMHRRVIDKIGLFDESFAYSMDMEYYARAIFEGGFEQVIIPEQIGAWRWHQESKTMQAGRAYGFREEEIRIAQANLQYLNVADRDELQNDLQYQIKALVPRKAMVKLAKGMPREARQMLFRGLIENPSLLFFRPWLGALRQCLSA